MVRFFAISTISVLTVFSAKGQGARELYFARAVAESTLRQQVRDLVGFGNRLGGSTSGNAAAAYVQKQFRSSHLPVEVRNDGKRLVTTELKWSLLVTEPRHMRSLVKNEWLAGFSPTCSSTISPLVFVEVAGDVSEKCRGAAVVTPRVVTEDFYEDLVKAGAVCVLSFYPADSTRYSNWAQITNLEPSNRNPIPLFNISYRDGNAFERELGRGTKVKIRFKTKTTITEGSPKTVIASIQGKEDAYYIVCAHGDSDSGGPGADDNASGVSGILELGRVLNGLIRIGKISRPRYSIKFIVWGSEYFSASRFVKEEQESLRKIMGVMNYDEIGTGASRNCLYFESNDIPHNKSLLRVLNEVGEHYAGRPGFWKEATTNPSQGGTDSYVFLPDYLKRLGVPSVEIPSVTIYTAAWDVPKTVPQSPGWTSAAWMGHPDSVTIDFSRYYHSSFDVPEVTTECEPFDMVWAVKAVGIALLRLAWE